MSTQTTPQPQFVPTITIVALLIAISSCLTLANAFDKGLVDKFGIWYAPCMTLFAISGGICVVGLMMMRFWAVLLYTGIVAIGQCIAFRVGIQNILNLVMQTIILALLFSNRSKMRPFARKAAPPAPNN